MVLELHFSQGFFNPFHIPCLVLFQICSYFSINCVFVCMCMYSICITLLKCTCFLRQTTWLWGTNWHALLWGRTPPSSLSTPQLTGLLCVGLRPRECSTTHVSMSVDVILVQVMLDSSCPSPRKLFFTTYGKP